jgi:RNA polymerase sigma factor (sigma-70 family)
VHAPSEVIAVEDLENLIGELRSMARVLLSSEGEPRSLTPTALAISALRRAKAAELDWEDVRWENRRHFFGVLRLTMGHALVDHARRARARGRDRLVYVAGDEEVITNLAKEAEKRPERIIQLEEAMAILKAQSSEFGEVLELHYYAGFTAQEIAVFCTVAKKTVDRNLKRARIALKRLMESLDEQS